MINGTPTGYIMGYLKNQKGSGNNTNIVNLSTLFVKEEFRKRRVGATLYTSFENWTKENFGNDFALEVTAINGNDKAFEFYKSLGFSPIRTTFRKWLFILKYIKQKHLAFCKVFYFIFQFLHHFHLTKLCHW